MLSSTLARRLTRLSTVALPVQCYAALSTLPQTVQTPKTPAVSSGSQAYPLTGPRFEQTVMELQPDPPNAMDLLAQEPIRIVHGRKAVCDGGGGPLGHPKIYINLDKPGPRPCGYCGLQFKQDPHH